MRWLIGLAIVASLAGGCALGPEPGDTSTPATSPAAPSAVVPGVQLGLAADLVTPGGRTYSFVAEITGQPPDPSTLYCQPTTWGFGDGPALTATPSCMPWVAGATVPTRFLGTHTYSNPGRYEVTFSYGPLTAQTTVDVR